MEDHAFWYVHDPLVSVDLLYGSRSRAGLRMLNQIKMVENFKVLFKVNKGGLSYCILLFFLKGYWLLLNLDELSDLLGSKLNRLSLFRWTTSEKPFKSYVYPC